jgi:hypothetical protein
MEEKLTVSEVQSILIKGEDPSLSKITSFASFGLFLKLAIVSLIVISIVTRENFILIAAASFLWIPIANIIEKSCGTIRYLINFLFNSLLIYFGYLTVMYNFPGYVREWNWQSFVSILLADISIFCILNRHQQIILYNTPKSISGQTLLICSICVLFFLRTLFFGVYTDLILALLFSILYSRLKNILQAASETIVYFIYKFYFIKNYQRESFIHSELISLEEMDKQSPSYKVIKMTDLTFEI